MLRNLNNLESILIHKVHKVHKGFSVINYPEICSIVIHKVPLEDLWSLISSLSKLKKISLHYLPKLTSISNGLRIAPKLEWMSTYGLPLPQPSLIISKYQSMIIINICVRELKFKNSIKRYGYIIYILICDPNFGLGLCPT